MKIFKWFARTSPRREERETSGGKDPIQDKLHYGITQAYSLSQKSTLAARSGELPVNQKMAVLYMLKGNKEE